MNSNHQAPSLKVKHNICSWNCQHNSNTRGKIKTHLSDRKTLAALLVFYPQLEEGGSKKACIALEKHKQSHGLPVRKAKL